MDWFVQIRQRMGRRKVLGIHLYDRNQIHERQEEAYISCRRGRDQEVRVFSQPNLVMCSESYDRIFFGALRSCTRLNVLVEKFFSFSSEKFLNQLQ